MYFMRSRLVDLNVDHITPLQREPSQNPFDPHGLQTLCRRVPHRKDTARENQRELTAGEIGMARSGAIDD